METIDKQRWLDLCERALSEDDASSFEAICLEIEGFLEGRKRDLRVMPKCSHCGKPVPLENARIDGDGRAVHEECQSARLRESRRS
jgi:hypothetical protein